MTLFGVNITWTGVIATLVAVTGVCFTTNYWGAYENKNKAKTDSALYEKRIKRCIAKNRPNLKARLEAAKEIPDDYIDIMDELGFFGKIFGQYENYDKFKGRLGS